ncbi:MAG: BatD family protein, partial [Thiovulaceae bacterium]|nr:BatD family protein [Sulfurimonadaceae bacterium]
MKNTLGKILLFILLELSASADMALATYSLKADKRDVHIKEAVEITFQAQQKNHSDVMFFFLETRSSDDYKIELLQKKEEELSYHDKKTTYTYLLFPLKSGEIKVAFDFTIKRASDEAVAQVFRGGRNNVKWIETTNTKVPLNPIVLDVQNLKKGTKLVGDFKLISKIDSTHINSYESANITYTLEGTGYDEVDIDPIGKIDGVTVFADVTQDINKATKEGYQIRRELSYALVADKDFTIKAKEIKCYSTKRKSYYTIKTDPYEIEVAKLESSNLVDSENYPDEAYDFENIRRFFIYLAIFAIGFASAKLLPSRFRIINREERFG